jgi:copper chaperone
MKCGGCVEAIGKAVKAADPSAQMTPDLPGKVIVVRSDLPDARLREIVTAAGYPAEIVAG